MKLLKVILSILLAFAILWIIVALFSPKFISVKESVLIEQNRNTVFNQVNNLKNWEHWSPWKDEDSLMTFSYGSKTIGEGASISWKSMEMGNGSQKIIESLPYEKIRLQVILDDFDENFANWEFIEKKEFECEVIWTFEDATIDFLLRPLSFSINNSIRKDFRKGLEKLKYYCENNIQQNKKLKPGIEQIDAIYYIAKHIVCDADDRGNEMGKSYGALIKICDENNWEIDGMPFSINYVNGEGKSEFDVAFKTKELVTAPPGFVSGFIPAGDVLSVSHFGLYENLPATYALLEEWMKENGFSQNGNSFEIYITDPGTEPDSTKWETRIYCPVIKSEIR